MKLALIFGGRSGEHDVSIVSARSVAAALGDGGHEVVPMAIDRRGLWATDDESLRVLKGSGNRADQALSFTGVHRLNPSLLNDSFDVAFPVLHGPFGEDGTIQGLFEMLDLPYVGCGVASSALCMDKVQTKRVLVSHDLSTAPWVTVKDHAWLTDPEALRRQALDLGLPLFVKPSRMGSSVGITKVVDGKTLDAAIATALRHDTTVLIEKGLEAREIEVAVLGNQEIRASVPGEVVPGGDFYTFEDKYVDDTCRLLAPAPLDQVMTERVQEVAVSVFDLLGCQGMARVDIFLEKTTGGLWVNEVNTIPGFTSISMYPRLWKLSGLAYPDLLNELLRLAIERHDNAHLS
ncbi:MAG: D-alanine--D-alanine ligase A [Acidobacteria bacterium]|nr:MAG: D-alanine--D-alanine ligase A [Acidobacteriota bacterium]